ncbi:MAG: DUF2779 domain-containing protein [Candidatus Woesearchaeota archaeon]
MDKLLTKSAYMKGLESPAYLWKYINDRESLPKLDITAKYRIDQGILIENYAKRLYDGYDLSGMEFNENLKKTKDLIMNEETIYEAGFKVNRLYVRSDILIKLNDGWELIEIKGSTRKKSYHYDDLSYQKYVLEKAGININKVSLILVNRDYEKSGEINPEKFLKKVYVTKKVKKAQIGIEKRIKEMLNIIDKKECPKFNPLNIRKSVHGNPLIKEFEKDLDSDSIFNLTRGGKKINELYKRGITKISKIPKDFKLSHKQKIQRKVCIENKPHIEKNKIEKFLKKFKYPLVYMDFETMQTAIPKFENSNPYQSIPFQYSIHIEKIDNLIHKEFLYRKENDPRRDFIENLIQDIPNKGSIIVWNKHFEKRKLEQLAKIFPEFKEKVKGINDRIIDLMVIFKNFWYHHKDQEGSYSVKKVLPIFSKKSYKELEINNGSQAFIIYNKNFGHLSKDYENHLLEYCKMDTYALKLIKDELLNLI